MVMYNSFSIKRCWQVLRWLMSVNRMMLLGMFAGTTVGIFLIELGMYVMTSDPNPHVFIAHLAGFAIFLLVLSVILFVSLAFTKFTQLGTMQQRASFLMLPAMNLEKFLAVIFYVTVVCTIVAVLSFVIADGLRMGAMAIWNQFQPLGYNYYPDGNEMHYTYWWSSALPKVWNNFIPIFIETDLYHYTLLHQVMYVLSAMLCAVWVHSSYTLGGTLLRKYSFVVTTLILFLCVMFFSYFMQTSGMSLFPSVWRDNHYVSQEVGPMAYVLCVLFIIFSCFNYWASFRMFKGFQLITNKWTNYDILKR